MRIAIGNDHRGFEFKKKVINILTELGYEYQDFGSYDTKSVDYPDIARKVGEAVASGKYDRGILICDTGIGMSIAANKVKGIRAALCYDAFCATRARLHNDANVLALAARLSEKTVREILNNFLTTGFEGGRHIKRINKIETIEGQG
ncbi:MAG: ribose 5-phosphate isomerase B [Dehalococcoidales bacterium]|nr:ribose 5-phosphate isomerase B [Dehalococcoidales bacterium]